MTGTSCLRAVVGAVLLFPPCAVSAQVIAINAGRVVDPETGTAAANQVILVEGPTIKAVGAGLLEEGVAEPTDTSAG